MVDTTQTLPSAASITRVELDNGIVVLAYEKPDVQSVVIAGSLPAGSAYVSGEQAGLAAITAASLTRGTQNRDFDALHTELEMLGADLGVDAGRFKSGFSGKALAEDLPTLVGLLADVLRNPAFPEGQIERLRGEVLTGLNYSMQDTRYRARRAFREALYMPDTPYYYSTQGTIETITELKLDDLKTFHAKHYGPAGMTVVVVGNIQADNAVAAIREAFGDWMNSDQAAVIQPESVPAISEMKRVHTPVAGKTQSDIVMGFVGPSRYAPDYNAARLINSVLGQFGMMGRIGDVVREEKGMAYYSYSSIEGGHGPGAWSAAAGVSPENVEEAINDITNEFNRIVTEAISDEELDNVQAYFTGNLPLQLESNEGIANTILRIENYKLGLDYLLTYRDEIYGYSKTDLLEAARRYINPKAVVISVAGPAE